MTVMDLLMASRLLIRQFKELTCNLYSKTHKVTRKSTRYKSLSNNVNVFCSILTIQFVLLIIRSANVTNPIKLCLYLMLNNTFF